MLDLNGSTTTNVAFGAGGGGTVTLAGTETLTGTVDNTFGGTLGTLTLEAGGNTNVTGIVGGTNALLAVNVASAGGDVNVLQLQEEN